MHLAVTLSNKDESSDNESKSSTSKFDPGLAGLADGQRPGMKGRAADLVAGRTRRLADRAAVEDEAEEEFAVTDVTPFLIALARRRLAAGLRRREDGEDGVFGIAR